MFRQAKLNPQFVTEGRKASGNLFLWLSYMYFSSLYVVSLEKWGMYLVKSVKLFC